MRFRWAVIIFWVAAALVATLTLPTLEQAQVGALGDLVPANSAALDAELRSTQLFSFPLLSRTLVVERAAGGLSTLQQAAAVNRAVALNKHQYPDLARIGGALVITNLLGKPPFSRESSTTAITYLFFAPNVSTGYRETLANRFVDRQIKPGYHGFVGVTGAVAARAAQAHEIKRALPTVELGTILLVLLVVGLHFRAIGAPLVTLLTVGIAYLVSIRLIAFIGKTIGVSVPSEVQPVIVVLLFGVVTDYSIFFLTRIRRRLAEGHQPDVAAMRGTTDLLPIIVTAGITVVAASAALVVAKLGFYKAFGPGTAMAVLIGLLVSITLIPALLAVGGRRVYWPRGPQGQPPAPPAAGETDSPAPRRRGRHRALRAATERPALTVVLMTVLLLVAATGALRTKLGSPLIRGLPQSSSTRQAYEQGSRGFAPGILSPTVVIVEAPNLAAQRPRLIALQGLLAHQRGVAQVIGPAQQPVARQLGAVYSPTGTAARLFIVLTSDPLGAPAISAVEALQQRLPHLLATVGLAQAHASIAGDTALVAETVNGTAQDIARITPASLGAVLLILIIFLGALVAPLYLLAASALTVLAALGLTTYLFQDLLGYGELTYYVPFATAVLLTSLGSDYNVFLAGQIWHETRHRPLRAAVAIAGARAATPITIAGLVLAASFALLGLVPLRPFHELAFAMAAGLLIDAFLVRTLLVPALITLVGPASGWPRHHLADRTLEPGTDA
ncbi:MAG: MMPL family transporter [Actinomycetota bacterium]|nr:MMPL family transporter [Actinomycetota bacterium]